MFLSRRKMLQGVGIASTSLGIGNLHALSLPSLSGFVSLFDDADKPCCPEPSIIRYDAQCFTIHGRDTFIYSACCHYTRTPKPLWRDRLIKLKQAGFNTIETYVFWNYHEPVQGMADMTEFEDFVKLVHEMGLWLIVRVGPYVCAEWDAGGFPHWIIEKQFPLRSADPESIKTSQSWYDHVLPIVRENMITKGGPVILIQIENEYDYWELPSAQKMAYVTSLARMVWKAHINIPIITNWVKQSRDNTDPVMAQIIDTCDFYPRWNITREVIPALAELRRQEPTSPVGIAELQGGWFSQFGGLLSVEQNGVDAGQFNALTKTVIENAATYLSVYMGHGGTNFDWAARDLTTTYDYAAPVREAGGLWDKYYATRTVGAFLDRFGSLLARSHEAPGAAVSDNPDISVSLRVNGKSGVLFVRNDADSIGHFHLKLLDPYKAAGISLTVPREGVLSIAPRGMKMLAVQTAIPGCDICHCTAEILTFGCVGSRTYLVIYDDPGNFVEIAVRADHKPTMAGELLYQSYDPDRNTVVLGFNMELAPKYLLVGEALQIVALPYRLAARTWTINLPSGMDRQNTSPLITDCSLMRASEEGDSSAKVTVEYPPGEHDLTILTPASPRQCTLDAQPVSIQYSEALQSASIRVHTPPLPYEAVIITDGEYWVERFEPSAGEWLDIQPVALEKIGQIPYGYVKYRAEFEWHQEEKLFVDAFTNESKQVFLNGRRIAELSLADRFLAVPLAGRAKLGANLLEISYEAFGSSNFGPEMENLTGISGIRIGNEQQMTEISKLEVQRVPAAMRGREIDPQYSAGSWQWAKLGTMPEVADFLPAYTWFRTRFLIPDPREWFCPWKSTIAADRDALMFVNGRFVGFYRTVGPQDAFYLPEPWLYMDGRTQNILTVVLAYADNLTPLTQLTVSPYIEFAARRTEVAFEW